MKKISTIRWGVILLGIGLFFLAINFDYLGYSVWVELISLWPILLIAIGLEFIFSRTKYYWLGLLSPLLIAATFAFVAFSEGGSCVDYNWPTKRSHRIEEFSYELSQDSTIKNLKLDIDFGLGELWISPVSDKLFLGEFEYSYKKPKCSFKSYGGDGEIRINTLGRRNFNMFHRKNVSNDANIFIADNIPLDLDLDIGAANVDLDLSDLIIKKLILDTGAAKIDLKLGCRSEDDISVDIDAGASRITIGIPREMGLEIDSDAALSSTNFKKVGLEKYHGKYRSDNYDSSDCRTSISIDSGVSSIRIQYY
ncbi:MAG: hypothetical protein J7K40_11485 [candidate division Zixibacteria bacterium]|nr:hypothetical protein [candidate division Zixibacteria bacterium]